MFNRRNKQSMTRIPCLSPQTHVCHSSSPLCQLANCSQSFRQQVARLPAETVTNRQHCEQHCRPLHPLACDCIQRVALIIASFTAAHTTSESRLCHIHLSHWNLSCLCCFRCRFSAHRALSSKWNQPYLTLSHF